MRGVERVAGEDCGEEGGEADHQQWPSRAENIYLYLILFFILYYIFYYYVEARQTTKSGHLVLERLTYHM